MTSHDAAGPEPHPYRGAVPYRPGDSMVFFGRAAETRRLSGLWSHRPLTVLTGDTGCGKTSLLQAGVLPQHPEASVGRLAAQVSAPLAALPPEHNPWTLSLLTSLTPMEPAGTLAGMSFTDHVGRRLRRRDGPLLVAIDQFEELFQGGPHRALRRTPFIKELAEAIEHHPGLRLLLVIRASHRDDLAEYGSLFDHAEWATLGPLSTEAAIEAISRPLEMTTRRFTDAATGQLVDEIGGDAIEPVVLQAVCARLWERLPPTLQVIGPAEVFRLADVADTLERFTAAVLIKVAETFGRDPEELRAWANAAFTDGHPAKQGSQETAGMGNAIVHALENEHLLRSVPGEGVRLLHDGFRTALATLSWTRARTVDQINHHEAALSTLAAGDFDTAERHAAEALRIADPVRVAGLQVLLGDIQIERVRIEQALSLDAQDPAESSVREERVRKGLDKALTWYRHALQQYADLNDPTAAGRMLAVIGQVMAGQGELSSAVQKLEEARSLLPRDLALRTELARALWLTGRRGRAMTELDSVLRDEGDQLAALRVRAEFNADRGRAEEALKDLRRVSSRSWPTARAARALALATLERLAPGEAEREVGAVVADAPSNGPALLYAARVEALSGDIDAAAELARRAIDATRPPPSPDQKRCAQRLLDESARIRDRNRNQDRGWIT